MHLCVREAVDRHLTGLDESPAGPLTDVYLVGSYAVDEYDLLARA